MNTLPETNTLESVNYKGEITSYTGSNRCYYLMQHRADSIHRELLAFIEPFVECGFDAEQIKAEMEYQGNKLVTLGQINAIIKELLEA